MRGQEPQFGLFTWRADGRYSRAQSHGNYVSEKVAQKAADRMNAKGGEVVVRTLRYLHNPHRKISKRAARLMGRRRGRTVSRKNPRGRSEREAWDRVEGFARRITRTARNAGVIQDANNIITVAMQMGEQVRAGIHENPTLAILGNPGKAKVVGTLSRRLYELRYKHAKDGKDYRHPFGPGASVLLLSDGNVLIRASHRLWEDI